MQRFQKWVSVVLTIVVFSGITTLTAVAIPPSIERELPPGMIVADQDGTAVDVNGLYFVDANDLQPGDVRTKEITILNVTDWTHTVHMMAEPYTEHGPLNLLDEVHLLLEIDGRVIYDGPARGDQGANGVNMLLEPLYLGTYISGSQRTLHVTLTVNPDMEMYVPEQLDRDVVEGMFDLETGELLPDAELPAAQRSTAYFRWIFYAERNAEFEPPETGDLGRTALYFAGPALVLLLAILILVKKRKQQIEQQTMMSI